ncbi:CMRF35-like molecule 5 [Leuresthes tenuis]|uniref:CMRF35-like molecule 5 n=1 Tax=Leuresthes tenuis TaxID=355514 RepID=UPI003B50973B
MKTAGIFFSLFNALVFSPFSPLGLTKDAVDSVELSAPEEVTATLGGSATVSCKYDLRLKYNTKYWCKGLVYYLCKIVVKTPRNRPNVRSLIADHKEEGVFTVTMTQLTERDESMYWCVIARSGIDIYKRVQLFISHTAMTPSTTTESNSLLTATEETRHIWPICFPFHVCCSWWAHLRWILLFGMLACVASTHIAVWRMTAAGSV